MQPYLLKTKLLPKKGNIEAVGYSIANRGKIRIKNSELFARNPLLLARPQTFVLHQILRHVSSSEFTFFPKFYQEL